LKGSTVFLKGLKANYVIRMLLSLWLAANTSTAAKCLLAVAWDIAPNALSHSTHISGNKPGIVDYGHRPAKVSRQGRPTPFMVAQPTVRLRLLMYAQIRRRVLC
jgi:hypothetical protein